MFSWRRGNQMIREEKATDQRECEGKVAIIATAAVQCQGSGIMHKVGVGAITATLVGLGHYVRRKNRRRNFWSEITLDIAERW